MKEFALNGKMSQNVDKKKKEEKKKKKKRLTYTIVASHSIYLRKKCKEY